MSARERLADAVAGLALDVDGEPVVIDAITNAPEGMDPWQAWPVWQSSTWRTRCIREDEWLVLVTLPNAGAASFTPGAETLLEALREALSAVGGVTRAEPAQVPIGDASTTVPALALTVIV